MLPRPAGDSPRGDMPVSPCPELQRKAPKLTQTKNFTPTDVESHKPPSREVKQTMQCSRPSGLFCPFVTVSKISSISSCFNLPTGITLTDKKGFISPQVPPLPPGALAIDMSWGVSLGDPLSQSHQGWKALQDHLLQPPPTTNVNA